MAEKYDSIGIHYNQTRKADPYLVSRIYHHLQPHTSGLYLDIGSGSGNYTHAISQKGVSLIGVEPSDHMRRLAATKNHHILWKKGKAENIPLDDTSVDGIMASLTLHHWTHLEKGLQELYRVLKPHGRLVIFTATPRQMKGYWLNHYFPIMLQDSMIQMPSYKRTIQGLQTAGFSTIETEKYFIQPDLQDQFLYAGKHEPNLYLKPTVRQGISSFSALANQTEVVKGLKQLEDDIATGAVWPIIQQYQNEEGDYLFVKATKTSQ